jgi:hypothetical protein
MSLADPFFRYPDFQFREEFTARAVIQLTLTLSDRDLCVAILGTADLIKAGGDLKIPVMFEQGREVRDDPKLISFMSQPAALTVTYELTIIPSPMLSICVTPARSRVIRFVSGIRRLTSVWRLPAEPAMSRPLHCTTMESSCRNEWRLRVGAPAE